MISREESSPPGKNKVVPAPEISALPKQLGRYEVGAKIAGGGMASVFLGRAKSTDGGKEAGKTVALKLVRQEFSNRAEFNDMFLDEAKILAQLTHPNIIETLEIGLTEGHRFIAMELLLGRTLADIWETLALTKKAMPKELACWAVARVADALHYAHELTDLEGRPLHIIHRDVNPTNIFVTYDGKVKLIDFGLVKAIGRVAKSAEGVVKGKVPYLSPEQITEASIDRRSDIYTLGITLWEMTTGRRLFKRESDAATIRAIQKAEVPDPRKDDPKFPEKLWAIIQKSLAVRREERYATADEMAKALNAYLAARDETDLEPKLARFMTDFFPGEHDRQLMWLAQATTKERSSPNVTLPPPIPLAEVSAAALRISLELEAHKGDDVADTKPAAVTETIAKKADNRPQKLPLAKAVVVTDAPIVPPRIYIAVVMLAVLFLLYALLAR
ncbi:MAG: serine/threonine-protein kinase [Polyangiaceae bacterium]